MTDAPPAAGSTRRLSFIMPDDWHRLDLDPQTRDRSLRQLIRRSWGTSDEHARMRRELFLAYREMIEHAVDQHAFFAAIMQDIHNGFPVSASLLAFLHQAPVKDGGEPYAGIDEMAEALATADPDEELLSVEMVDLPIGRAVETRALVDNAPDPDGEVTRSYSVRYLLLTDSGELLVLSFSTPLAVLGDDMARLFRQMALVASLEAA
jgi:hypothetical protein